MNEPQKLALLALIVINVTACSQAYFSSDEAYKYVNPFILFWLKYIFLIAGNAFLAVKAFYTPAGNGTPKTQSPTQ